MSLLSFLVFKLREIVLKKLLPIPAPVLDDEIQGLEPEHDVEMGWDTGGRVSVLCIWGYMTLPPNGCTISHLRCSSRALPFPPARHRLLVPSP